MFVDYPWSEALWIFQPNGPILNWLMLPSNLPTMGSRSRVYLLIYDFCVLLCMAQQFTVFRIEENQNLRESFAGGTNETDLTLQEDTKPTPASTQRSSLLFYLVSLEFLIFDLFKLINKRLRTHLPYLLFLCYQIFLFF